MQKRKTVYKLKRKQGPRKALIKMLASELILKESIETSEPKAKAVKPYLEKTITLAKKNTIASKKLLFAKLNKEAVDKATKEIAKRYAQRPGGYTRIVKIKKRHGDNTPIVNIQLV
jgi:large subunit ribosomal protein L17